MSRWFVRRDLRVIVVLDEIFGTGKGEAVETLGEEGVNLRGASAMESQCITLMNSLTSEGKFLGYIVRTSPGK